MQNGRNIKKKKDNKPWLHHKHLIHPDEYHHTLTEMTKNFQSKVAKKFKIHTWLEITIKTGGLSTPINESMNHKN
jgi:hypothetical protein